VTAALLADAPAPAAGMGPDWQYLAAHGLDAAALIGTRLAPHGQGGGP
jgi:hypothetical protein